MEKIPYHIGKQILKYFEEILIKEEKKRIILLLIILKINMN